MIFSQDIPCSRPECKGANEIYLFREEAPLCDTNCSTLCLPCKNNVVTEGCFCKTGYARGASGPTCADPNEIYLYHYEAPACDANCSVLCKPCKDDVKVDGCFCKTNYARDENGVCIPIYKCRICSGENVSQNNQGPTCQDPNEIYLYADEAPNCDPSCSTICSVCETDSPTEGCYCKPSYTRDNNGVCILISDCPLCLPVPT
ncbi:inducible metalloproteinase inhibitor protein-like [Condylostylus longicornis]|uniref:inducible metalloproteinase inhibitor protein-like n=1 Tax=Condylostylus longicornis TaxID=2530218 RepID=UPI00244E0E7C|nr:inducible metalloproteinase inhibitor protein-like [Condylostylus longicornis]